MVFVKLLKNSRLNVKMTQYYWLFKSQNSDFSFWLRMWCTYVSPTGQASWLPSLPNLCLGPLDCEEVQASAVVTAARHLFRSDQGTCRGSDKFPSHYGERNSTPFEGNIWWRGDSMSSTLPYLAKGAHILKWRLHQGAPRGEGSPKSRQSKGGCINFIL